MANRRSKSAFTLVEMLVSLAIIGIISMTILMTLSTSIYIANKNEQRETAISIKTGIADSIKASQSTWANEAGFEMWLITQGYSYYGGYSDEYYTTVTENGEDYEVTVKIEPTGTQKLFQVRITVDSRLAKDSVLVTRYYG